MAFRVLSLLALVCAGLTITACGKVGFDLSICGTADWDAKSRGADTTTDRTIDVDFSNNADFKNAEALFDDVTLATATVSVVSVDPSNKATSISGKLEVGPSDGSTRTLIAQYTNLSIQAGSSVNLTLDDAGKKLVAQALKAGTHSFKAYVTGNIDQAPAAVKLEAKFTVNATVAGGGTKKDLGCVSLSITAADSAPTCSANPCRNGGTCAVAGDLLVCTCADGFGGLQCETPTSSNSCASVTCENGGSCAVADGAAVCDCVGGFTGEHCEIGPSCGQPNTACSGDAGCCPGLSCDPTGHCAIGGPSCGNPSASCAVDADCCAGLFCDPTGHCAIGAPSCGPASAPCGQDSDCCMGLTCDPASNTCGQSSSTAPATFTGTVRGQSFTPADALSAQATVPSSSGDASILAVVLTNQTGVCGDLAANQEPKSSQYFLIFLGDLQTSSGGFQIVAPTAADVGSDFQVYSGQGQPPGSHLAILSASTTNATCQDIAQDDASGISGTVHLTSLDAVGNAAGTFDVTTQQIDSNGQPVGSPEAASGTFTTTACASLGTIIATNRSTTCF